MDDARKGWYFSAIMQPIPAWQLYGEHSPFPDILHIERIPDRAAGLDWRIAPHRHLNLHQIFLILSGSVRLAVDGTHSAPVLPALINIPRGTVHGFTFAAGTEGYVLSLPTTDFPELFGPDAEPRARLGHTFLAPVPPTAPQGFAALAALHAAPGPLRRLRLRAAAVALCCEAALLAEPADGTPPGDPLVLRFESLVRANLPHGWRLADYARALALSDRQLQRQCHAATGLSAHAFIEQVRQREACRLLAYTRMQVQEVGFALGFDDPAYFARAFRRATGLSPGDYRARLDAQAP